MPKISKLQMLFHETKASIYCLRMLTTHLSWSFVKRIQILARNEVHLVLKTNFSFQQNEGLKCYSYETKSLISCIPVLTTHLYPIFTKIIQILAMNEVHPVLRMNFDSQQNKMFERFFFVNQSINIMYRNVSYPFVLFLCQKNLDSFHE